MELTYSLFLMRDCERFLSDMAYSIEFELRLNKRSSGGAAS